LAIDPNGGGNDDYVAQVWDITKAPYKLVNWYAQANTSGDYSTSRATQLFDIYKPKFVPIESNSIGFWAMEAFSKARSSANVIGVNTNQTSKRINTDRLVLLLEASQLSYPSDCPIVIQMKNFRQNNRGQRMAAQGFRDDFVMCAAIGLSVVDDKVSGADLYRDAL